MVGHMSLLREIYAHFVHPSPGKVGLEGCGSLLTNLHNKKTDAEKFPFRLFLAIQQSVELEELANVYWLPGSGNPADSSNKVKSETAPLPRWMESGT